jgi:hypothetical protein
MKAQQTPQFERRHFEFLADELGTIMQWPTALHDVADALTKTNPRFDRDKFLRRAMNVWEQTHELPDLEDEIPY